MPIISVNMLAGRPWEKRRTLMARMTDVAVEVLGVDPSAVRVILTEVPPEHWSTGGQPKAEPHNEDER